MARRSWMVAVAVLLAAWGCGGDAEVTSGSGAAGGAASGGASGGGSATGGTSAGGSATGGTSAGGNATGGNAVGGAGGSGNELCPATPPADGAACVAPPDGGPFPTVAHCSWGDDPRPACRTSARCTMADTWEVTEPAAMCTTEPLPAACPAGAPTPGTVCADATLACWYPGQNCFCSDCAGGSAYPICQMISPPEWACRMPAAGCPSEVPQAGAACAQEGLDCGRSCELPVVCTDGFWVYRQNSCPMCAAPTTLIATPEGERPISELREGDLVYTVDDEAVVVAPLLRVSSTRVANHHVMRVTLESGAVLEVSAAHPLADGRTFADLTAGSRLDGVVVVAAELVPFRFQRTYDILPASDTRTYFAAGVQIGTTLR